MSHFHCFYEGIFLVQECQISTIYWSQKVGDIWTLKIIALTKTMIHIWNSQFWLGKYIVKPGNIVLRLCCAHWNQSLSGCIFDHQFKYSRHLGILFCWAQKTWICTCRAFSLAEISDFKRDVKIRIFPNETLSWKPCRMCRYYESKFSLTTMLNKSLSDTWCQ